MMRPPLRRHRASVETTLQVDSDLAIEQPSSLSARGFGRMTPALLISTSTPPNAPSAISNMRVTAMESLTSACAAIARPPGCNQKKAFQCTFGTSPSHADVPFKVSFSVSLVIHCVPINGRTCRYCTSRLKVCGDGEIFPAIKIDSQRVELVVG
jgi:hypothetical protein